MHDLEGARKDLDEAERILDSFDSVETVVHASFYRVNADYYQVRPPSYPLVRDTTLMKSQPLGQARIRLLLPQRPPLPRLHQPLRAHSRRTAITGLRPLDHGPRV